MHACICKQRHNLCVTKEARVEVEVHVHVLLPAYRTDNNSTASHAVAQSLAQQQLYVALCYSVPVLFTATRKLSCGRHFIMQTEAESRLMMLTLCLGAKFSLP